MPNPPAPANSGERAHRVRTFQSIGVGILLVVTGLLLPIAYVDADSAARTIAVLAVVDTGVMLLMLLNRTGRTAMASWLLITGLVAVVTYNAIDQGGIASPGVGAYVLAPLAAAVLLNERAGFAVAGLCMLLLTGMAAAEQTGILPPQSIAFSPWSSLLLRTLYMAIALGLMRLSARVRDAALSSAREELAQRLEAEERLALALEAGAIGTWELDVKTHTFTGNARGLGMFGYSTLGALVTLDEWSHLINPADRTHALGSMRQLLTGTRMVRVQYGITAVDGVERQVDGAGQAVLDEQGRVRRIVGTVVDITERQQKEEERRRLLLALGQRVKELRLLHEATSALKGKTVDASVLKGLVDMMPQAWAFPEVCEARFRYGPWDFSTPGWQESPWRQAATFTAVGIPGVVEVCYRDARPEADEGPFLTEERALLSSLADLLRAQIENDHSERQRHAAEVQLRQAQKMEALGTLAGGIAHDFNNILTAIMGNTAMALAEPVDATVREHLTEIDRAGKRAADLVRRILLFSRRSDPHRRVAPVTPTIDEALSLLRTSFPASIQIQTRYEADLPAVHADTSQLHQIIMNLGTNAAHAMREKGGVFSVEVGTITFSEARDAPSPDLGAGRHIHISVRDAGCGISPELLDRIFDPFFSTKGLEGTGLGLSTVHGIVHDHGGALTVESELNRGTAFHIYLPAVEGSVTREEARPAATTRGQGQRVMYVDDETALVLLVNRIITRLGYHCTGFTSPAEALQAFRKNPAGFDAVITDFGMPGMNGAELTRQLRAIRPGLPVAITSGYGDATTGAAIQEVTPVRIPKPMSPEDVARALNELLAEKPA